MLNSQILFREAKSLHLCWTTSKIQYDTNGHVGDMGHHTLTAANSVQIGPSWPGGQGGVCV